MSRKKLDQALQAWQLFFLLSSLPPAFPLSALWTGEWCESRKVTVTGAGSQKGNDGVTCIFSNDHSQDHRLEAGLKGSEV